MENLDSNGATPRRALSSGAMPQNLDLIWFWSVLVRGWMLILLPVLLALVPTVIYLVIAEPSYRSTATIQVNPEPAKVLPYRDITEPASAVSNFDLYMKTQDELLRSKLLQLRVDERLRKDPAVSGKFQPSEVVEEPEIVRIEGSQIMKLSCQARDPILAAAMANAWADEFLKLHLELRGQTNKKAEEFLQEQLKVLKGRLEDAEKKLVHYAGTHQILNLDSKQENVVRQRFGFFSSETARAEKDFFASKAEYEGLKAATLDNFPDSLRDPVISSLETRTFAVEQELTQLLAQFDEKWPAVVQKKQELALLKTQLTKAKRNTLDRTVKQAELKFTATRGQYEMLQKALGGQAALVDQLNQASVEYNSLKREMESTEQLYQGLLQRLKETGVSAALEFGNIQIADRARPEKIPFRPRRNLSVLLAVCFGLTLGVGLTMGREYLQRTLRNPWELEQLGIPLLGWVPKSVGSGARLTVESNGSGTRLLAASSGGTEDNKLTVEHLRAREFYRALCVSMMLSQPNGPPRVVLVTSSVAREGKTTTAAVLAEELSAMGMNVLLIDADFRSRALSRSYGLESPEGLSTYLAGGRLAVTELLPPNLSLLPAGTMPPNPVALLNSRRFEELLNSLMAKYAVVVMDGPPVLSVADAQILAAKAKAVMFVVNSDETPKDVVNNALQQLRRSGATIIGGVVNKVDMDRSAYSHYGKYYYDEKYLTAQSKS